MTYKRRAVISTLYLPGHSQSLVFFLVDVAADRAIGWCHPRETRPLLIYKISLYIPFMILVPLPYARNYSFTHNNSVLIREQLFFRRIMVGKGQLAEYLTQRVVQTQICAGHLLPFVPLTHYSVLLSSTLFISRTHNIYFL